LNTCKKITGKVYEDAGGIAILNVIPQFLGDLYKYNQPSPESFEIAHQFHKDNVQEFKGFWGEQSCTWVGYGRFWVWMHERENCNIFALACPTRGPSYEIAFTGNESKAIEELKLFLTELKDRFPKEDRWLK
jgi:hypothetical protein